MIEATIQAPAPVMCVAQRMTRWPWCWLLLLALLVAEPLGASPPRAAAGTQVLTSRLALVIGTRDGTILRTDAANHWHRQQSLYDGPVSSLAASRDGRTLYAATTRRLWRSHDGGAHWTTITTPATPVGALAVSPGNADVVYAWGQDVQTVSHLYQSTDGGGSWLPLLNGLHDASPAPPIVVDPGNPASVWAGARGGGIVHSMDGGSTWTATYPFSWNTVESMVVSPAGSAVIYAGTQLGLYWSPDGGETWAAVYGGMAEGSSVSGLAISPRQPSRIYATAEGGIYVHNTWTPRDFFYYSSDGGTTWTSSRGNVPAHATVTTLLADPLTPLAAYAATDHGLYRTGNGGATWSAWHGGDLDAMTAITAMAMAMAPRTPADPVGPACCGAQYFPRQQHNLADPFLTFYRQYGGLDTFGYPRTEAFIEAGRLVQYTDRFRLEVVGGHVRTAQLGRLRTRGRIVPRVAPFPTTEDRLYFSSAGHALSGEFLSYWRTHDGAVLLGAPIAEPTHETNNDGTGRAYVVQWFAHGRLEYHGELAGTPYEVELGLVGEEALQDRGWLPEPSVSDPVGRVSPRAGVAPVPVGGQGAGIVAAGAFHSAAVSFDRSAWTWGWNEGGQLGRDPSLDAASRCPGQDCGRYIPAVVPGLTDVSALAASYEDTLALRGDGTVWTWGQYDGVKGATMPEPVPGLVGVLSIAAGEGHSLALTRDGLVWAWGANSYGQMGNGSDRGGPFAVPRQVPHLSGVVALAAGYPYNLVVRRDGTVWAWGINYQGQLGTGDTTAHFVPTQVQGLTDVVAVAAGNSHSLALTRDGAVWAWGNNYAGQVGLGPVHAQNIVYPAQVPGLPRVVAIAAGYEYSLALGADGTVWSWGDQSTDHLRMGACPSYSQVPCSGRPARVSGLPRIVAIAAGYTHSLAVAADGTVWAWGSNGRGELGTGDTRAVARPVAVRSVDLVANVR